MTISKYAVNVDQHTLVWNTDFYLVYVHAESEEEAREKALAVVKSGDEVPFDSSIGDLYDIQDTEAGEVAGPYDADKEALA